MTIMITGGSGFVGLNIAERLLAQNKDVLIFDRNPRPQSLGLSLEHLPGTLSWVTASVTDRSHLIDTIKKFDVHQIVHGAAITAAQTRETSEAPEIAEVNLIGTIQVLEAALHCQIDRVVQLGTGSVYGSQVRKTGVLDEETDIPVPESLYGVTKYAAERTALRYRHTRGLNVTVARLGVVFGRYEYDTGVRDTLSAPLMLASMAEAGTHAKVYADLPDDWVYATDVATGVDLLLERHASSGLYHLATGHHWSIDLWCRKLQHVYPGFTYEMVETQSQADVGRLTPSKRPIFSIDRISRELGYRPDYMLDAAFEDYLQWRRSLTT